MKQTHIEELVRLTNEELQASLDNVQARLGTMDSQAGDVERRLDRLYDALETGRLDLDDLAPRIKELKQKRDLILRARAEVLETLGAGKVELVSREVVLDYLRDLKGLLENGTVTGRRLFLRSFIESIELENSQVTIRYVLPLPPEQVPLDSVGVLAFDSLGGADITLPHQVGELLSAPSSAVGRPRAAGLD